MSNFSVANPGDNRALTSNPGSVGARSSKTVKPKNARPEVKIEWNNRTEEDYLEKGFDLNDAPVNMAISDQEVKRFLSEVDVSKAPIERTVYRMFRIKAVDYDSPKRETKEWLYYEENWNEGPDNYARNRLGEIISPVAGHVEGMYHETLVKEVLETEVNANGYEEEVMVKHFSGLRPRYYVPFTKEKAQEIIKNSTLSDENNIQFMVKIQGQDYPGAGGPSLHTRISADMFLNWTFDELWRWMTRTKEKAGDWSRESYMDNNNSKKSANNLQFKPS